MTSGNLIELYYWIIYSIFEYASGTFYFSNLSNYSLTLMKLYYSDLSFCAFLKKISAAALGSNTGIFQNLLPKVSADSCSYEIATIYNQ